MKPRWPPVLVRARSWRSYEKNRNLCTVYINIREFKQRRLQRNDKKPNRLILAKQQLCTCIALCTFRSRRCTNTRWKCLNKFHVLSRTEHKTTTFLFFSWTLIQCFRIQLKNILPTFDELNMMYGISAMKFKAARNHFLRIVFVTVAVVDVKTPYLRVVRNTFKKSARGDGKEERGKRQSRFLSSPSPPGAKAFRVPFLYPNVDTDEWGRLRRNEANNVHI